MIDVITYALLKNHLNGSGGSGTDGKSAYDIAVDNGFSGSEAEWLESLKGKSATISIGDDGSLVIDGVDTNYNLMGESTKIPSEKIQGLFE